MTRAGPFVGVEKECFRCVASSVPPAKFEYSPPEREVGMLMMGAVGVLMFSRCFGLSEGKLARSSMVFMSFANA